MKVARDRKGNAPNKPLLVLSILDLVEAGLVGPVGLVHKDAELNLRFDATRRDLTGSINSLCMPLTWWTVPYLGTFYCK